MTRKKVKAMPVMLDAPTSYGAALDEAKANLRKGLRQLWCPKCRKWRWSYECSHMKWRRP